MWFTVRLSVVSGARWNRLRHFSFLEAATEQKYVTSAHLCFGVICCLRLYGGRLLYREGCNLISTLMLTENVVLRHFIYIYI